MTVFVILLALGIIGVAVRLIAAHNEGLGWLSIVSVAGLGVVGILLFTLVLFAFFDWRNTARARSLAEMYPSAYRADVVTDPTLVRQIDELSVRLYGRRSKVRQASYVTLVADTSSIRFFAGSRRPREQASFPTSMLHSTGIGESQSGARIVPSLELHLDNGDGGTTLNVHLFVTTFSVPRFVRGQRLIDAQRDIRASTGTTT
ncbi:MAG: hypothetical protein JWQ19_893 [Subtercola sp.]|nr:hypothetical protein [Subtercola sp.]